MGNGERPLSYLIHKILSVLQASKGPLSRNEIINLLLKDGVQVSQSNQVWQKIDSHERIRFDINKRKYVYRSPFEDVNSDIALLALIRQYQNGLLIDEDLLKTNANMDKWIRSLLCKRAVRCLRQQYIAGKIKCKNGGTASTGSSNGTGCSLYSRKPCENCSLLKGVVLYPLNENVEIEELKLDDDIKDAWKSIIPTQPTRLEDIIRQTKGEMAVKSFLGIDSLQNAAQSSLDSKSSRRKSKADFPGGDPLKKKKIKIRNLHIFDSTGELFSNATNG